MSNYPTLWQNVLGSLETDEGEEAFIWAAFLPTADRYQYKAERFAREVDRLAETVWGMVVMASAAHKPPPATLVDLFLFIMKRHVNYSFPQSHDAYLKALGQRYAEASV